MTNSTNPRSLATGGARFADESVYVPRGPPARGVPAATPRRTKTFPPASAPSTAVAAPPSHDRSPGPRRPATRLPRANSAKTAPAVCTSCIGASAPYGRPPGVSTAIVASTAWNSHG